MSTSDPGALPSITQFRIPKLTRVSSVAVPYRPSATASFAARESISTVASLHFQPPSRTQFAEVAT